MIYLASPYSHKDPAVMEERYIAAMDCTAWLLKEKQWVYSPIVHCHELARKYELPKNFYLWKQYNEHMIMLASSFYILDIPGWKASIGVIAEREWAETLHVPVFEISKNEILGYSIKMPADLTAG